MKEHVSEPIFNYRDAVGRIRTVDEVTRWLLTCALQHHNGNVTKVSQSMEVDRRAVYRMLKKYHLDPAAFSKKVLPPVEPTPIGMMDPDLVRQQYYPPVAPPVTPHGNTPSIVPMGDEFDDLLDIDALDTSLKPVWSPKYQCMVHPHDDRAMYHDSGNGYMSHAAAKLLDRELELDAEERAEQEYLDRMNGLYPED